MHHKAESGAYGQTPEAVGTRTTSVVIITAYVLLPDRRERERPYHSRRVRGKYPLGNGNVNADALADVHPVGCFHEFLAASHMAQRLSGYELDDRTAIILIYRRNKVMGLSVC